MDNGLTEILGWTTDALAELERTRGWTEEAIERLELGWRDLEHRVVIPIRDATLDELGDLRYDPTGRRKPKMLADAGIPRDLFPPPEAIGDIEDRQPWLVEGEPDAIRLWSLGLPAIAVPGAGNWKDEWASRFSGRRWEVAICFDCDTAGRENALRAATALTNAGITARLIDLDPERNDGYDLTDWAREASSAELRAQAADALRALAAATAPYRPSFGIALTIVPLPQFAAVQEEGAKAILGTADNAVIPEGGDAMIYGDGGVGKTTLMVDLALHLAAGDTWLGLNIPRPVRVLLVENEGPRPLFRRKLERKLAGWQGSPIDDRVQVLEEPWGELSFADGQWRAALAAELAARQIDVLIAGPVTNTGMDAAGTITEARAFIALIGETRTLSGRPVAVILVHHENKGGKVSGAWEGTGDTLLHVQQQGHGQIRLYFQKARWASDQHATTLQLKWAEGDSFALADDLANRPEQVWETLEQFVLNHPGCTWKQVLTEKNPDGTKLVRGQADYLLRRRDQMLTEGVLINLGHGRGFELWHRDDPARPQLPEDP